MSSSSVIKLKSSSFASVLFLFVTVGTINLVVCVALVSLEASFEVLLLLLFVVGVIVIVAGVWSVEEEKYDEKSILCDAVVVGVGIEEVV